MLVEGNEFTLDVAMDPDAGDEHAVGCAYRNLTNDVVAGDTLLLDDGLIVLEVEEVEGTRIRCRVKQGGRLADHKGLNKQGGGLSAPALTDKDRRDIESAARLALDFMSVSFARNAEDIEEARRLLRAAGGHAHLVAKIERAEAVTNIRSIIDASDVIMVARGDLAVEVGYASMTGSAEGPDPSRARAQQGLHHGDADARVDDQLAVADACRGFRRRECGHGRHRRRDAVG